MVKESLTISAGRIVLGVSGSIAAFKAAVLASDLVKAGYEVRVILTPGGARFVNSLTFAALTGHPAWGDVWEERPGESRMGHLDLARWADCLLIAPASAGAIARVSLGLTDDLLGAVALSCQSPLLLAPAMESAMFAHPATQQHLDVLRRRGATIVGPASGRLASGALGVGRMAEPTDILAAVRTLLAERASLAGRRVLVTAGPTYEPIDRVRFIGNRSSGKMGYAVAAEAARRGAEVILVSGPTALETPAGVQRIDIATAAQMREAVAANLGDVAVTVMAAAVADFRPSEPVDGKVRRADGLQLALVPTVDIAAEAVRLAPDAIHVGFALEPADLIAAARAKLERKHQHLVVANLISPEHDPFGADQDQVAFVTRAGAEEFASLPKTEVASLLWDRIASIMALKISPTA